MDDHLVGFVVFESVQLLDVVGPAEVFSTANWLTSGRHDSPYGLSVLSGDGRGVRSSSGIGVEVDEAIRSSPRVDTALVAGGIGAWAAAEDPMLLEGIAQLARRADRFGSVCSGALLLAATGLLDGHTVTTHWAAASDLAARHPRVDVEPDRIFCVDGRVWTSAGVTAGIDLALEMVSRDHGPQLAREVARQLVVFAQRPGGQSQFSTATSLPASEVEPLREVQRHIVASPTSDCSASAMARRVGLSERHLQRLFRAEFGVTLGRFVDEVRLERARALLETTSLTIERVAREAGFGSDDALSRSMHRHLATTASDYRKHFGATAGKPRR